MPFRAVNPARMDEIFPVLQKVASEAIATSGVAPEAVMKLDRSVLSADVAEAKRIQFKLLELTKIVPA